jgi:biotin synthase
MPKSHVRLSAGREEMNDQLQSLAFLAGANSIFYGEKLLTTANPKKNKDMMLFDRLGINPEKYETEQDEQEQEQAVMASIEEAKNDQFFYNAAK